MSRDVPFDPKADEQRLLTNKQMADAFGGYDFVTTDMKRVCQAQDAVSFPAGEAEGRKQVGEWLEEHREPYPEVEGLELPFISLESYRQLFEALCEGRRP